MTMRQFLKENRTELDRIIQDEVPGAPKNDDEREAWVLNDQGLYEWARSEGVRI